MNLDVKGLKSHSYSVIVAYDTTIGTSHTLRLRLISTFHRETANAARETENALSDIF